MGFFSWILLGLVAGFIAKKLSPGKEPNGCLGSILVGVAGAVLGGWLSSRLMGLDVTGFNFKSILIATAGAVLCLIIYRFFTGDSKK